MQRPVMFRTPCKVLLQSILLFCLTIPIYAKPLASDNNIHIKHINQMYQASMKYIFDSQQLINHNTGDKSQLFAEPFIKQVKLAYTQKYQQPFPSLDHPLKQILVEVMIEVMEDNRTLIYDTDIQFKGLIPAIYAFQLSEKLKTKGLGLVIKFTSSEDMVRNQLNLPDDWERLTINKVKTYDLPDYLDTQAVYKQKPATRYFSTVKLTQFCLDCHGSAQNNPMNRKRPKPQWTNVDITGFEMENWTVSNFGGGVSVVIYDK